MAFAIRSSLGLCPWELPQAKGYIWPCIPCLFLIRIQYTNSYNVLLVHILKICPFNTYICDENQSVYASIEWNTNLVDFYSNQKLMTFYFWLGPGKLVTTPFLPDMSYWTIIAIIHFLVHKVKQIYFFNYPKRSKLTRHNIENP